MSAEKSEHPTPSQRLCDLRALTLKIRRISTAEIRNRLRLGMPNESPTRQRGIAPYFLADASGFQQNGRSHHGRLPKILEILAALFLITLASTHVAVAQENRNEYNLLLLPTSQDARKQLQESCSLWTQKTLRTTTLDFLERYGTAVWIDRHVDPSRIVELRQSASDSTLGDELQRIAAACGVSGGLIENVYLIAPADRLARIQRSAIGLHGQLARIDKTKARKTRESEWPDITTSNELLELVCRTWDVTIEGELPHDLFHSGKLPKCTLATQLALLLGGFDLQAVVDRSKERPNIASNPTQATPFALKLKSLSSDAIWEDNYARNIANDALDELAGRYPDSNLSRLPKGRIVVRGETNLHEAILAFGVKAKPRGAEHPKNREPLYSFSMDAKLPVEMVLSNLAQNFRFDIEWSADCTPIVRNRLIQLQRKDATRQQLLEQIATEASLLIVESDNKIRISPKPVPQN